MSDEKTMPEVRTNGLIKMRTSDLIALIVFFVISIIAFFPSVRNTMYKNVSLNSWILVILTFCVPIYNIIAAYLSLGKKLRA